MIQEPVDVLIIGSGHAGGMAAKVLCEKGIKCLMLNAGPVADVSRHTQRKASYQMPFRGFKPPGKLEHVFQASEANTNVWVDEQEVPYTFPTDEPYNWVRVRLFGGRSLFWSRQSFRLSNYELKAKSHDGFGENWPIDYAELAPYYSRAENILQVSGALDGPPQMPDGNFILDNDAWTQSMTRFIDSAKPLGIPVCKPRIARGRDGLASSVNLMLPDAEKTGNLTSIQNAIVREITVDKNTGQPNGVNFIDRLSHREMHVKARIIVLAAGTLETTRLLLNSNNLANSSGLVGHYLCDQIYGVSVICSVPEARNGRATPKLMGGGSVIPRFRNIGKRDPNFLRGYAVNVTSRDAEIGPANFAAYGAELQRKMDEYRGSFFYMSIMGEALAHRENHVSIDPVVKDAWGIPALHIETKYGENEFNMAKDAVATLSQLGHDSGFEVLTTNDVPNPPGYSIHEVGTCRMMDDPKQGVLNRWGQTHDHKNLFIVDGASFTSAGWQNPTLTIVALSMRASEHLAGEMAKQNV